MPDDLLEHIGRFCQRTGVAKSTFGRLAVNDGKLVQRLNAGGDVRPKTRDRILKFIKDYKDPKESEMRQNSM